MIEGELNFLITGLLFFIAFFFFIDSQRKNSNRSIKISGILFVIFIILFFNYFFSEEDKAKKTKFISNIVSVNTSNIMDSGVFVVSIYDYYSIFTKDSNGAIEKKKYKYNNFLIYEDSSKEPNLSEECIFNIHEGFLYDIKGVEDCRYSVTVPLGTVLRKFEIE